MESEKSCGTHFISSLLTTRKVLHAVALLLVLFVVGICFFPLWVSAEHGLPGFRFVFSEAPPPTNTLIPLAGANGVPFSLRYIRRNQIRAVAADHSVPLKVVDSYDDLEGHKMPFPDGGGGYGENLILLSPRRQLRPNTAYTVMMGPAPEENDSVSEENSTSTAPDFTTGATPDTEAPSWRRTPFLETALTDTEDEYEGEQHSLTPTIVTAIDGFGDQPGFVVIALSPLEHRGRSKRMIASLEPAEGRTEETRCARVAVYDHEFNVHTDDTHRDLGRRYRATLTAVDMAGNRRPAPGSIDIVWNTWLNICNRPEAAPNAERHDAPRWTGPVSLRFDADLRINGIPEYGGTPYSHIISLPVTSETGIFAELTLQPSANKNRKPYRFIAKLPPKRESEENRCGYAYVANNDRDRLQRDPLGSTPKTVWTARVKLVDPLGRTLLHNGPPLNIRLDNNPLLVCIEDSTAEPALTAETAAPKWNHSPKMVIGGLFPSHPLRRSDVLLVDIDAGGAIYLLITVREAGTPKGKSYPFQAVIVPDGALEHGCAAVDPPQLSDAGANGLYWIQKMKSARMKIEAMDTFGRTSRAPDDIVWTPTRNNLVVCLPDSVKANENRATSRPLRN